MYNTSLSLFSEKDNIVKKDIQTIEKQGAGASIGISITIVFMFTGCILGGIFIFKNKNNIKRKFTMQTATPKIELTENEKKYLNENPIFSLNDKSEKGVYFTKGLNIITKAVELDNGHYYKEALENYNKGIDQFMIFLKMEKNSQTRFNGQKIDIYLKRTQILQKLVRGNILNDTAPEVPKAPVIKNREINL